MSTTTGRDSAAGSTVPTDPLSTIVLGLQFLNRWDLEGARLVEWIEAGIEMGATSFDLADIYGEYTSEEIFGQALKSAPGLRQRIQIVTKCGVRLKSNRRPENRVQHYDLSAEHISRSLEHSLGLLNVEAVDLLLLHRPDALMDVEKTGRTLDRLLAEGKAHRVGVSNFSTTQFDALQSHMSNPLATNQIRFNILHTQPLFDGTLDQACRTGFRPMAYAPFDSGRLFDAEDSQTQRVQRELDGLVKRYPGMEPHALSVPWILRHPSQPHVVVATRHLEKIRQVVDASKQVMDPQDWYLLLEASRGHPVA